MTRLRATPRRSRLSLVLGVAGLILIGAVSAFAYRAVVGNGSLIPSLPPIIKASGSPNKIVPAQAASAGNTGTSDSNTGRKTGAARRAACADPAAECAAARRCDDPGRAAKRNTANRAISECGFGPIGISTASCACRATGGACYGWLRGAEEDSYGHDTYQSGSRR